MRKLHRCSRCKRTPEETPFSASKGRGSIYQSYCQECMNFYNRKYRSRASSSHYSYDAEEVKMPPLTTMNFRGNPIKLGPVQLKVMTVLMQMDGEWLSATNLGKKVWGTWRDANYVAVYVAALRKILGKGVIERRRDSGYRIVPGVSIKPDLRVLELNGKEVKLTKSQGKLMGYLLDHEGEFVSWKSLSQVLNSRCVESHMYMLRKRIGYGVIEGQYGKGYRIRRIDGEQGNKSKHRHIRLSPLQPTADVQQGG